MTSFARKMTSFAPKKWCYLLSNHIKKSIKSYQKIIISKIMSFARK